MPSMFSRTIAVFRWIARATIVFVALMEQVASPSRSSLSVLGRYRCSCSCIVPCERGDNTYSGVCYSHAPREIIVMGLLVGSNR